MTAVSLVPNTVHIWLARSDDPAIDTLVSRYEQLLDLEELTRYRRFRFSRHRRLFLVAHALVRTTLSRYADVSPSSWRFVKNDYGRPFIDDEDCKLRFNLSHTDGLAACAVATDRDVGVDIESLSREVNTDIAGRYFAAAEVEQLVSRPSDEQRRCFLEFWTLKESYIKARGRGLSIPLGKFAFQLRDDSPPAVQFLDGIDDDPGAWSFRSIEPLEGQLLAVTLRHPPDQVFDLQIEQTIPLT